MPIRVDIDKRELERLAHNFHQTARVHAGRELDKAMVDAGNVVERGIRASTDFYMPRGYEQVFKRSLIIAVKLLKGATRRVTLTGRAYGRKGHDRQVENLERGQLRHPVFDSSRKRWAKLPQRIRPNWMSEPARKATPAAVQQLERAAERIADHFTRGL